MDLSSDTRRTGNLNGGFKDDACPNAFAPSTPLGTAAAAMALQQTALRYSATAFPFHDEILRCLDNEGLEDEEDLGPVDSLSAQALEESYRRCFGGTSPLSSATSSPSTSPMEIEEPSYPVYVFPPDRIIYAHSGSVNVEAQTPKDDKFENSKQKRNKKKSKAMRQQKRQHEETRKSSNPYSVREATLRKHVDKSPVATTQFQVKDMRITRSSYLGLRETDGRIYGLREIAESDPGFTLIKWDGRSVRCRLYQKMDLKLRLQSLNAHSSGTGNHCCARGPSKRGIMGCSS